ncbi:MAG: cupin domain-containing protein [Verrucomicrobiota bacterium]|jgi:mannose-6-phosphate isomerase-like protein (cupin superfamily)|nr:cupin domain-containing protein [Verrucomicrobiota bacterium]
MIAHNSTLETEHREQMRGGQGTVQLEHWFKPGSFGANVRLCARMTLPPGASIGNHTHEAEDEIYLVLSGSGIIQEKGEWVPVRAGDAILTGQGGSHGVENTGDEPLVIAAVIIPYPAQDQP